MGRKWEVGRLESLLDKRSPFISERNEEVFGGGEGTEEEIAKQAANQAQECVSVSQGGGLRAVADTFRQGWEGSWGEHVRGTFRGEPWLVRGEEGLCQP